MAESTTGAKGSLAKSLVGMITFVLIGLGLYFVYNSLTKGKKTADKKLDDAVDKAIDGASGSETVTDLITDPVHALTGSLTIQDERGSITEAQLLEVHYKGDTGKIIRKIQNNIILIQEFSDLPTLKLTKVYDDATIQACNDLTGMDNISLQDIRDLSLSAKEAKAQEAGVDVSMIMDNGNVLRMPSSRG